MLTDKKKKSHIQRTVRKYSSFAEEEAGEKSYWQRIPGDQKLEILEIIRSNYFALEDESGPRFQRVYRITECV